MTVLVVTGGARGLGRGTVDSALRRGWTVVAADLSHDGDLPAEVTFLECDVASPVGVEGLFAEVVSRFGRVDAVHANAGVADWEPFLDMSESTFRRVLGVNLDGVFFTAQCAGRHMAAQGGGALVLTSSVRSVATNTLHAAYGAAKGAVNSLVTALAVELGPLGIRVNAVQPGACETPMQQAAADLFHGGRLDTLTAELIPHIPLGRLGAPEEVGDVVTFLLSPEASYVHGAHIPVDGGLLTSLT